MHRQVNLTILELGCSPTAWANTGRVATDDWVVVAQQPDETTTDLVSRVLRRALRVRKDNAEIVGLDVYAPTRLRTKDFASKLWLIRTLIAAGHLERGAIVTLWFDVSQLPIAAELTETIATRLRPLLRASGVALAMRFHQTFEEREQRIAEEPSGIHALTDVASLDPAALKTGA
jgi:hypothetical protein